MVFSSDSRVVRADADPRASRWGQRQTERVHRRRVAAIISQRRQKKKKREGRCMDRRDPVTPRASAGVTGAGRAFDS